MSQTAMYESSAPVVSIHGNSWFHYKLLTLSVWNYRALTPSLFISNTRTTVSKEPAAKMYSNWGCHYRQTILASHALTTWEISNFSVSYIIMLPLNNPRASKCGLCGLNWHDLTEEWVGISPRSSIFFSARLNFLSNATTPVGPIAKIPLLFQSTSKTIRSSLSCSYHIILFLTVSTSFTFPTEVAITQNFVKSSSFCFGLSGHQQRD